MTTDLAFDAWIDKARLRPIDAVASMLQLKLTKIAPREFAGACPRPGCVRTGKGRGPSDRFAINLTKNVYNCRHCGGGDGIGLVMMARTIEFVAACEFINGEPPPDRDTRLSADDAERLAAEAAAREKDQERQRDEENQYREGARKRAHDIWRHAVPFTGMPAEAYLMKRLGLADAALLAPLRLRCVMEMPFYSGDGDHGEVLARVPALAAPIVDTRGASCGTFRGVHLSHIDLAQPKGKLAVRHPVTGDVLDAKKVRGSQKGYAIELVPAAIGRLFAPAPAAVRQVVMGEGIEKVLAVWLAMLRAGRDISATAFVSAINLGNLGGKSAASWAHPSLKSDKGRAQRVPGPVPDLEAPAIEIPDSVTDLVLLGDSTSDPFTTTCALARATARYARDGRTVRTAWAPANKDFDDILREAA